MDVIKVKSIVIRIVLTFILFMVLPGCDDSSQALLQREMQGKIAFLEAALLDAQRLQRYPLHVEIQEFDYKIKDQMFEPLLFGKVVVAVNHEQLPPFAYLQLRVEVNFKQKESVQLIKVVWVDLIDGKGEGEFQISLPGHELDDAEAIVSFVPLSWYRGLPVIVSSS